MLLVVLVLVLEKEAQHRCVGPSLWPSPSPSPERQQPPSVAGRFVCLLADLLVRLMRQHTHTAHSDLAGRRHTTRPYTMAALLLLASPGLFSQLIAVAVASTAATAAN